MFVLGCDCRVIFKTSFWEMDVPYSSETVREAVSVLYEEASIEGDGVRRAVRKAGGGTGCVITPLTIGTAPLLLSLAFGAAGLSGFVSGSRNVYRYGLSLSSIEETEGFDLIQDRNGQRRFFEGCRVSGFELRIVRGEAVKLRLDIFGENSPSLFPYNDTFRREAGERFHGDFVVYAVNGREVKNIYGVTLSAKKENGTRTEIWLRRALEHGADLPEIIEEMTITARLARDKYEARRFGTFLITLKRLVLVEDETEIDCADAVIGSLRYYAAGGVSAEVFTFGEKVIA